MYSLKYMDLIFIKIHGIRSDFFMKCVVGNCNKKARNKNGPCEMHYYRKRRNGSYELSNHQKVFSKKITFKENENGCFEITSHKPNSNGYSLIRKYGKRTSIHRFIYEQCFGEIPLGLVVRHKCDNKSCINPEHLLIGTRQDNVNDAIERNRYKVHEEHPNAKLTIETVSHIKKLLSQGMRNVDIADILELKPSMITDIKREKTWKNIS